MNSSDDRKTEDEIERYRVHCAALETHLVDLQLELSRLQHFSQSIQRLLDTRSQQLAQQHSSAAALQRRLEDHVRTAQLELERKQNEAAALNDALAVAERDVLLLRSSLSWHVTAPARWLLRLFRGF